MEVECAFIQQASHDVLNVELKNSSDIEIFLYTYIFSLIEPK